MAKRGRELDWITIKYKDIYSIILVLAALGLIGGGVFFYWRWHGNPKIQAERALTKAQRLQDTMDTPDVSDEMRATLRQTLTMLQQARNEFAAGRFPKALSMANDVLETLKNAQASSSTSQKYATLVTTEGQVEVKRTGQHLFTNASEQMILEDGDIVRTGKNSSAQIKYHNGQIQIISSDSLVVIQALSTSPAGGSRIEVALKQGFVETQTPETMTAKDESIIATDTTKVRPAAASRIGVGQAANGDVTTSIFTGAGEIEAAGQKETLQAGATGVSVVTTSTGIGQTQALVPPPVAETPKDQQIFRLEDPVHQPMVFKWKGGGAVTRFELSAKPLFSSLLTDQTVRGDDNVRVEGMPAGTYYWRLRAEGDAKKTFWSPIYRFRILQIYQRPKIKRDLKLSVDATPIGDGVILQGTTDPGVSISVNDIEVPVNADGTFSKIVIFSDYGTQSVQVRAFDDEGNETIWRKQFQSVSSY